MTQPGTLRAAIDQASRRLAECGVDAPRLTAELLIAHALGHERSYLYAHDLDPLPPSLNYHALIERRARREPLQHITGVQEFYGRPFHVTPEVLIPRPETEHVVERALQLAPQANAIADIGTGSGAIGVTLSLELRRPLLLTDLSAPALRIAQANANQLGAACTFVQGDTLTMLASQSLDLIVSNPPYIPLAERETLEPEVRHHDPALALFGGESGNDIYAKLLAEAPRVLRPGGWIVLELGWQSAHAVRALAKDWCDIQVHPDLAGRDRVFSACVKQC